MTTEKVRSFLLFVLLFSLVAAIHPSAVAKSNQFAPPDPVVLEEFHDLEMFIADLAPDELQKGIRNSLVKQLENAESAYEKGQPCTAVNILGAFLNHTSGLVRGKKAVIAEELRNRCWMLRHNLLASLPPEVTCPGFKNAEANAKLKIKESSNQCFVGSVSFGKALLHTVQAAGEVWTQVEIPSLQSLVGKPGMPAVPAWQTLLAVPMDAKVHLNMAAPKIGEEIPLHLYPFQQQAADASLPAFEVAFANPPFEINESAYEQEDFYPADPCSVALLGQVRDLTIAQLTCSAGQYNPATRSMRLFDSIEFEIVFEGGNGAFVSSQSLSPFEKSSEAAMAAVANHEVLRDYVLPKDLSNLACYGEELLILTHPDFKAAADDLADWKREKGISTTVVEVGEHEYYDEPHEIDDLIEQRYDNCVVRPSYILLLGDVEFVPPARQDVDTSDACGPCDDETTGSDYAYAIYPRSLFDIFPDFAVGRIPVDTDVEAELVINKIIRYESEPPFLDFLDGEPFYTTAANAAAFQCCRMNQDGSPRNGRPGTDQRAFIETSELVRNQLMDSGYSVERIYTETVDSGGYCLDDLDPCTVQEAYTGSTTPNRYYNSTLLPADLRSGSGFAWDGSTDDIIASFNEGRFLVLHRDHGQATGFSHPVFNIYNLPDLANGEFLPLVYSVNCLSGYFDRETDYDPNVLNESFMEQLLLLDNGGMVGGLAANRKSPTWANNAMARGFYDATWLGVVPEFGDNVSQRRLGDILNHAKMYLLTQIGVDQTAGSISLEAAFGNLSLWHAFGDPTLEMWTSNPHWFSTVLAHTYDVGEDRLTVRYDRSGAIITALQETENGTSTVPVGRATVKNGTAIIPFFSRPLPGLPINLSASFENAVSVQLRAVPDGPDLVVEKIQLDSVYLNPGTHLKDLLKIKVSNLGNDDAPGTVNPDGSVKVPPQGYMIDLVLSADAVVPEGFATSADVHGVIYKEDALLVRGRVSRTPDVPAMSSVILPTGLPISSDVDGIIPSQTPPGSYYLCARIDPGEAVPEADEVNNLTCREIVVGNPQVD